LAEHAVDIRAIREPAKGGQRENENGNGATYNRFADFLSRRLVSPKSDEGGWTYWLFDQIQLIPTESNLKFDKFFPAITAAMHDPVLYIIVS